MTRNQLFNRWKATVAAVVLSLAATAATPTAPAKPWTFWYWMYGAVSKEGIRADLQAMKDVGLGGCYLMPIRGTAEAPATMPQLKAEPAQQLTPAFWQMVDYAMQQADSLGLEFGIHVCDGFALAGGPWITPEESMQKVVWTDTIVNIKGKRPQTVCLPTAAEGFQGYYEDIAAFAVKAEEPLPQPKVTGTIVRNESGVFRATEPGFVQFDYDEPQTVRSVEIVPSGNNIQAQRLLVQASDDGTTFRNVRQLVPPRQGWQNTDQDYTYALPETTARHFRFCWTPDGTEPGSEDLDAAKWSAVLKVKDIRLSADWRIDQYEAKNGSVWRIAAGAGAVAVEAQQAVAVVQGVTKLSPGRYRIIRFGHTSTGHTNATAGGGRGLECDKFSVNVVNKQIDGWFGQFMGRPHSRVVKYMHVDSWECGSQNWSKNFAEEFQRRRGYDLMPWMPVYAGVPVAVPTGQDADRDCKQVLRDIRLTINELVGEVFFTTVKRRAQAYGVSLSCESVAPTMVSDGMDHYKYADLPMGEFWLNSPTHDKPNDMLDAISGAHVYGKPIVQAEGFTEVRGVWDETPAQIKTLLDRNFALGMNRLFFHVFTHNPWTDLRPGMTLDGIGLFFQRDQTWFPEARAFVDYVTRCQTLLQKGMPVTDIAVYTGEEMPRRSLTPDRLVPMLPGLFGPERVASERLRLANAGQPMEESPVGVRHSAGIPDLKDWINPLHGYLYDSMNPDALLSRPFTYKVLVVPEGCLVSPRARRRMEELRDSGVTIIEHPYEQPAIAGLQPDAVLPEGVAFCHRLTKTTGDDIDIYFLSNQTDSSLCFQPKLRAAAGTAYVYDALTDSYCGYDGTLSLKPRQSLFVVFGDDSHRPVADKPQLRTTRTSQALPPTLRWQVAFRESGQTLLTDTLFNWSLQQDPRLRYFSGHARYTTTFKNKRLGRATLVLGNVSDMAHVWLNGTDCGIVWTAPFEIDVTHALRKGRNKLEIEVVNTWHNALRGLDLGTPPYEGIWTNARYRTKGDGLLPAGLLSNPQLFIEY